MRFIKLSTISTLLLIGGAVHMPTSCRGQALEECGAWEVGGVCLDSCGCSYCAPSPLYMRAEYLHAWVNNDSLPALISSSPSGTDRSEAGILGEPGTRVLFGDEPIGGGANGVRGTFGLRLGHYFDCLADWQVESTLIWLGSTAHPDRFSSDSDGDPILARPFFDTSNDAQNSSLVAYPGVVQGSITADVSTEVNSACILFRRILHWDERLRFDALAGYRYFNYSEQLAIDEALVVDGHLPAAEQTYVEVADRFGADNRFDGCEVGILAQYRHNAWEFEALGKLAFGQLRRQWAVDGLTYIDYPNSDNIPVDPAFFEGGFLASPGRIGVQSASEFAVLPELNLSVRHPITPDFLFTFGYTLIYLNDVIRLGGQIDTSIDSHELEPSSAKQRATELWVHGFTVGLEW